MSTVFTPPGQTNDKSGKHMNSVSTSSLPAHVIASGSAANADHVSERAAAPAVARPESPAGWDAYEVWRRCIKDARDRRQHQE
jgi:hypothetical protein